VKITEEVSLIVLAKEPKKDETRCAHPSFSDQLIGPGGCLDQTPSTPKDTVKKG